MTTATLRNRWVEPEISNNSARVSLDVLLADRYEVDDTQAAAAALPGIGLPMRHTLHTNADVDWVWFDAQANQRFFLHTGHLTGNGDTVLTLFAANGAQLGQNNDFSTGQRWSGLAWTPLPRTLLHAHQRTRRAWAFRLRRDGGLAKAGFPALEPQVSKKMDGDSNVTLDPERTRGLALDLLRDHLAHDSRLRFEVIGECMAPLIEIGDEVELQTAKPTNLHVGDILLFDESGHFYTHRLLAPPAPALGEPGVCKRAATVPFPRSSLGCPASSWPRRDRVQAERSSGQPDERLLAAVQPGGRSFVAHRNRIARPRRKAAPSRLWRPMNPFRLVVAPFFSRPRADCCALICTTVVNIFVEV